MSKWLNHHYTALGLDFTATDEQIRAAWAQLSKQYHPDLNGGKSTEFAQNKFREVQAAYQILGNKTKRRSYDLSQGNIDASTDKKTRVHTSSATGNARSNAEVKPQKTESRGREVKPYSEVTNDPRIAGSIQTPQYRLSSPARGISLYKADPKLEPLLDGLVLPETPKSRRKLLALFALAAMGVAVAVLSYCSRQPSKQATNISPPNATSNLPLPIDQWVFDRSAGANVRAVCCAVVTSSTVDVIDSYETKTPNVLRTLRSGDKVLFVTREFIPAVGNLSNQVGYDVKAIAIDGMLAFVRADSIAPALDVTNPSSRSNVTSTLPSPPSGPGG